MDEYQQFLEDNAPQATPPQPGELLAEQAAAMGTEEAATTDIAAAAIPTAAATEAGLGIAETAGAAAATGPAAPFVLGGLAAVDTAREVAAAAQTQGSIQQYLIASGGAGTPDNAPLNAIVAAVNRFSGLRSRM
jgi:hypothetical protein